MLTICAVSYACVLECSSLPLGSFGNRETKLGEFQVLRI